MMFRFNVRQKEMQNVRNFDGKTEKNNQHKKFPSRSFLHQFHEITAAEYQTYIQKLFMYCKINNNECNSFQIIIFIYRN